MKKIPDQEEEEVVSATEMTGAAPTLPATEEEREELEKLFHIKK